MNSQTTTAPSREEMEGKIFSFFKNACFVLVVFALEVALLITAFPSAGFLVRAGLITCAVVTVIAAAFQSFMASATVRKDAQTIMVIAGVITFVLVLLRYLP